MRNWFSTQLITEGGARGFVQRGQDETGGVPEVVVQELVDNHLLRGDTRGSVKLVELIHDRFVEPIRTANLRWSQKRRREQPWIDAAWNWYESGDSPATRSGPLLEGAALKAVLAEVEGHQLEPAVQEYIEASKAREQATTLKTERRRVFSLAALAGGVFLGLIVLGILALGLVWNRADLKVEVSLREQKEAALITKTNELSGTVSLLAEAEAKAKSAQKELESVTLSRIVSRLDLGSEDQRQFALLLSQEAMAISPTLQAESASIEALDAAYRRQAGWQPPITPTVYFTEAVTLPFSSPLTMTLRRDGEAVAAVVAGTDVVVALNPSDWVTRQLTTSFTSIGALALSDDGKYIAVAGCDQKPDTEQPNDGKQSSQNSASAPAVTSGCSNWRIEVSPITEDAIFHRTVPLDDSTGGVKALVFHPFLLQLVAATNDGSLLHWRLSASEPVAQPVVTSKLKNLVDLAVSSDGMYLAALDVQGRNKVWSWATWDGRDDDWPPDLKANSYRGVSFVRDGSWFATVSNCPNSPDGQVYNDPCPVLRLWQRGTQAPIGDPILVGENTTEVGFDELSDTLTTVGNSGLIGWNLNRDNWEELVCQRVGRTLTYDEWKEAFPNDDLTTYQGACSKPPHSSFVTARIAEATKKLDDCSPQGTEDGWRILDYGDIPQLQTAVTILVGQALDRFERNQTDLNNPAAACLQEANTLLADEGRDEIPLETGMETARRLLDGESKMRSEPEIVGYRAWGGSRTVS